MCIERSQFYAETQASFNVCCQSKLHEGRAHRIVFGCFYFYSDENATSAATYYGNTIPNN